MMDILPVVFPLPEDKTVPSIPIISEFREVTYHPKAKRREMDISDQLPEIGLLLAHGGFIPAPEKGAPPAMAPVKSDHVSCEEPQHKGGQWHGASPQKQVDPVGEQGPGIAGGGGLLEEV